jgi:phage/plasmid-like protein (TIGR03299 family)
LGLVSDRYQIVQNEQAFDFVDELLKSEVRYETAGSLFGGKKIWLLANMPKVSILGDDIKPFMVFVNGHDGMTPTSCFFSAVRVVCNNTFTQAWNGAKTKFTTKHMGNLESKIKTAEQILGLSNRYMTNFEVVANELQDIKIPDMIELTSSLVPYPKDKEILTPRTIANIDDVRSGILYRLNAPDLHKFGNSGWAWLNAVSDYVCHADPVRANSNFKEKRFDNILNGNTLMDEGYSLLMDRFMKKIIQVESEVRKPLLKIKVGV